MDAPKSEGSGATYEQCRHLVWQDSPEADGLAPGPYCENPVGVFPLLDCPLFQGRPCLWFRSRPEGSSPEALSDAGIEELSGRLSQDYLTWRYWKRIRSLSEEE